MPLTVAMYLQGCQLIFSKFDFKDDMAPKEEQKKKLDPQAALNKLKKNKEKVKMWEEKGKTEKAAKIENNIAWGNALSKSQGEKVKDDVTLLKKSIKKNKQIKTSLRKSGTSGPMKLRVRR